MICLISKKRNSQLRDIYRNPGASDLTDHSLHQSNALKPENQPNSNQSH